MFDALTDRLQGVMQSLKGHGKLTAEDVDAAMREIRLALLEADVNFKVVREFVAHVKERALGAEVMESLTPAQQVVKIVNEELVELMGSGDSKLAFSGHPPTVILLAGLQGSGKTTACAKLAKLLKKDGKSPVLIAADVYRPAAIDQLQTLGESINVPVYAPGADEVRKRVDLDGVVLTKLDGDARGGAALSVRAVTGKPIKFASTGEKLGDFDVFHPDRMASRILGMGDVLSLIEKAGEAVDEKQAAEMEAKLRRAEFTFEDFLDQLKQVRKMGSLSSILGMLPGVPGMKELKNVQVDDRQLDRIEAMIFSMTPHERRHPGLIDGSRRRRIAGGSGTSIQDVNQLLKQYREMQKMLKAFSSGRMKGFRLPGMSG